MDSGSARAGEPRERLQCATWIMGEVVALIVIGLIVFGPMILKARKK